MIEDDRQQDRVGELIRAAGKRPVPSDEDYGRVLTAAHAAWQAKVRTTRRRRRMLAVAASLAAVVVLGAGIGAWLEPAGPAASVVRLVGAVDVRLDGSDAWRALGPAEMVAGDTRIRTRSGGRAALDVAGVSLRVDEQTELVIESRQRMSLETGTVYVDSSLGSAGIGIDTAVGLLRDVGTQFEVRSSADGLRLRVREGRVQLISDDLPQDVETAASEELAIDRQGNMRRQSFPPVHPDWAWAETLAASPDLDGRSAYDALRWVARETGRRLVFADPVAELRARNAILSGGRPDANLTPSEVLQIVTGTVDGLECTLGDRALTVRSR